MPLRVSRSTNPEWLFEIKPDGFRAPAYVNDGRASSSPATRKNLVALLVLTGNISFWAVAVNHERKVHPDSRSSRHLGGNISFRLAGRPLG